MNTVERLFAPIIGQIVWSTKRGHGSFLTLEFGNPHLAVREPIKTKLLLGRPKAALERRHVICSGQWGLWITYSNWKVSAEGTTCEHQDEPDRVDKVLQAIDGQRLLAVKFAIQTKTLTIQFDRAGSIHTWPPENTDERADELWALINNEKGVINTCLSSGRLEISKSQKFKTGSITTVELTKVSKNAAAKRLLPKRGHA
jgi:hypothetical protein